MFGSSFCRPLFRFAHVALALCLGMGLAYGSLSYGQSLPRLSGEQRENLAQQHGDEALERIDRWLAKFPEWRQLPEDEQLRAVNEFFNQLVFTDDPEVWGRRDYWATPLEFLLVGAGDCEDFTIAKYFSLRALGVPDEKLRISYVNSIPLEQAHMVLDYYSEPEAMPLVLDNLDPVIRPANRRPDLVPVYMFNGEGLWQARQRGQSSRLGDPAQIQRWQQMLDRMQEDRQP